MKTHTLSSRRSSLLKFCCAAVFAAITVLLIFFILHIIETTKQFHLIRNTQERISELSRENKNLKANILSSNFSKNTEALAKENYEEVGKIRYVKILNDTAIAKNTQ